MFSCPPLGHYNILDPILLCNECRGHLIFQVYAAPDVQYPELFPVELDAPLPNDAFFLFSHLGVVEYSHALIPKKKAPAISCTMDVFSCECNFL